MKVPGTCRHCQGALMLIVEGAGVPTAETSKLCAASPTRFCEPAALLTADERRHVELRKEQVRRWGGEVQRRQKRR